MKNGRITAHPVVSDQYFTSISRLSVSTSVTLLTAIANPRAIEAMRVREGRADTFGLVHSRYAVAPIACRSEQEQSPGDTGRGNNR
ncbi:MAG: hypothetical protein OXF02_03155 [Simkaniaceae bacterium]|nr:hypothetical protein [Simkaniaceae bacterium]